MSLARFVAGGGTLALLCAWVGRSGADPCPDLDESVVIVGSSAIKPLVAELARLSEVPGAIGGRIYYHGGGSCTGVSAILEPSSFAPESLTRWTAAGDELECEVTSLPELSARVGVSDVFPGTCRSLPNGLPANVVDFQGPVQAMVFVVPNGSDQRAISAEAAYYVFGFGAQSAVAPWTDPASIFHRDSRSGTQNMVSVAIGVPSDRFRGTAMRGTSQLLLQLMGPGAQSPAGTIGILSGTVAHERRATLRALAFQDFGSDCAVLPDRTPSSSEMENVRTGLYPIWGPVHLLTHVDAMGRPMSPAAETVIGFATGTSSPIEGLDLVQLEAALHIVPQCAMQVARKYEIGPLLPHAPEQPCGCYYEVVANGTTSCKTCVSTSDCEEEGAICSLGYCEARAPLGP